MEPSSLFRKTGEDSKTPAGQPQELPAGFKPDKNLTGNRF
jgi:hypothetical protein